MRRTIIYWISIAVRLAAWVAVLGVGMYVWQRGFDQSVEDFGWVWGLLMGLGEEGERIGTQRARGREGAARKMASGGRRGRTRGAGW